MKKYVKLVREFSQAMVLGLGLSLLFASPALAANITYNADTKVSFDGLGVTATIVSGSVASSVVVNLTNLVATIPTSSTFTLLSPTRDIGISGISSAASYTYSCTSGSLTIVVTTGASTAETITFSPSINQCSSSGGGSGGGGGGGGGGGSSGPGGSSNSTTNGLVNAGPATSGLTSFTSADPAVPALQMSIPANAVTGNTLFMIQQTTLAEHGITVALSTAGGAQIIGQPFFLSASSGTTNVTSFNLPITLNFFYKPSQLPAGTTPAGLTIMFFNTSSNSWQALPTTVDPVNNIVTAITNHFTVFALAYQPGTNNTGALSVSAAGAHSSGTLVLDGKTIYLIQNGQRVGFRDANEYKSYGYNFGQAVAASAADKTLSSSSTVNKALVGSLVIDASDNRTVYMIGTGQTKRGFASAAIFKALGYSFRNLLKINLSDYPTGPAIASSANAHPDGALVLQGKTVWWLQNGQLLGFESMAVFNTYGFSTSKIVKANAADLSLPQGPLVKFRDGTLVKDGSTYYLISDGQAKPFASVSGLTSLGYKTGNVISGSVGNYQKGSALQ